ncbi:hypothetical protein B296_00010616 [Ensete ventricosum]|uniref:Uncharacterized protein n=1 Tax=Ensete ventricosum TaxID=4639 RepID=A0A426ZIX8_ENSVE|nr:hypothetical protein B296_00010616 [Ensete ventricosum]
MPKTERLPRCSAVTIMLSDSSDDKTVASRTPTATASHRIAAAARWSFPPVTGTRGPLIVPESAATADAFAASGICIPKSTAADFLAAPVASISTDLYLSPSSSLVHHQREREREYGVGKRSGDIGENTEVWYKRARGERTDRGGCRTRDCDKGRAPSAARILSNRPLLHRLTSKSQPLVDVGPFDKLYDPSPNSTRVGEDPQYWICCMYACAE